MRRERTAIASLSVWLVLGVFMAWGCDRDTVKTPSDAIESPAAAAPREGVRVKFVAPPFQLERLGGGTSALSEFRGKVVLLNFWATWCGPCRAEMPSLESLSNEFPSQEFVVVGISSDYEGAQIVQPFVDSFGLTFPILLDPEMAVNEKFEIRALPVSILVDQQGVIQHKFFGAMDWSTTKNKALVRSLITGVAPPAPAQGKAALDTPSDQTPGVAGT